jgi:serine/threonine-protein kinase
MRITLTVIAGPHAGQVFTFTGHDRFLVGRRAPPGHFRLEKEEKAQEDRQVSRFHFLVEVNPPLCRLFDMGSHNGTFVNGQRVTSSDLRHGDEIRAGNSVLRVALHAGPAEERAAAAVPAPAAGQTTPWSGVFALPTAAGRLPPTREAAQPEEAVAGSSSCVICQAPAPAEGLCAICWQQAEAGPQPFPGYLLLRVLGRGAMGVVHLALSRADNLLVAVKTISPASQPRPGVVERFLREAEILRELDHPHIVRFLDMGEAGGQLFFAMDYVAGTDVAALLRRQGALPVRLAVRLVNQLLQALEYAHALGFVHRDIKPGNLLLEGQDAHKVLKVADFGLARVYQASQLSGLTLQNDLGGTVGFLPPEQITHFRDVQPSADQYSAAATLYYLLTLHHVHDLPEHIAGQLDMILKEDAVPIQQHRAELPNGLARAIHRALARDPEDRYLGVADLRRALLPFAR